MNGTAGATVDAKLEELLPRRFSQTRTEVERTDFLVGISILGDLVMLLFGFALGYWIRFESGIMAFGREALGLKFTDYIGLISLGGIFLLLTFGYLNLYNTRSMPDFRNAAAILFRGMTFWVFAFLSLNFAVRLEPTASRIYLLISYVTCLSGLLVWRWGFHRVLQREAIACTLRKQILFIGWSSEAARITTRVEQDPHRPYAVVGWIPAPLGRTDLDTPKHVRMLGDCSELAQILKEHQVDVVILADLGLVFEEIVGLANLCEKELVEFKIIPSYFQILLSGLKLEPISGVPILGVSELPLDRPINRFAKRVVDLLGSIVGLALSAPILSVLAVLIYLESPGPIFYRQTRSGRNGTPFKIIKLRSMRLDAESDTGAQWAKKDDPRRLRIGAFMREWNLDELPQFWNVLKGEMSLVGPRPERPELIAGFRHQIPHYNARLASKPGMTGWAQVNGLRGNTSLEERVRYDLHYLETWNLWFDFQTMFQTFFKRENAY
jgi:exopolysaccharide biosynthesis polyprenyl glycosylphosphotransferase